MTREKLKEIAERAAKAKECFMHAHPTVAIASRQYHKDITALLAYIHQLEAERDRLREAAEAMLSADTSQQWGLAVDQARAALAETMEKL